MGGKLYSSLAIVKLRGSPKLDPYFVTGFIDGEGSFSFNLARNLKLKSGWSVQAVFSIGLHLKDIEVLKLIQEYFGVGHITPHSENSVGGRGGVVEFFFLR